MFAPVPEPHGNIRQPCEHIFDHGTAVYLNDKRPFRRLSVILLYAYYMRSIAHRCPVSHTGRSNWAGLSIFGGGARSRSWLDRRCMTLAHEAAEVEPALHRGLRGLGRDEQQVSDESG